MGSKKGWGALVGEALLPGGIGAAVGLSAGKMLDDKSKIDRLKKRVGGATAVSSDDEAKSEDGSSGGDDPFSETTAAKKKKVNTLFAGSNIGALSGAGSTQGALTLGS